MIIRRIIQQLPWHITYFLIMFPKVWSSLFTVNIAAFVTFVSTSLTILKTWITYTRFCSFAVNIKPGRILLTFFLRRTTKTIRTLVERSFWSRRHFLAFCTYFTLTVINVLTCATLGYVQRRKQNEPVCVCVCLHW